MSCAVTSHNVREEVLGTYAIPVLLTYLSLAHGRPAGQAGRFGQNQRG